MGKKNDLIKNLIQGINYYKSCCILGGGDDASILNIKNNDIIISSDILIEGIHFNLQFTPLKHLGYKSVIVNISNIYAMNAEPTQIIITIAVSNKFNIKSIDDFFLGIKIACKRYKIDLIGADISTSLFGMTISIVSIGSAIKKNIVLRKGSKTNDLLVVSGDLGAAYIGLQLLKRETEVFKINSQLQSELSSYEYVIQRQLKPEAPQKILSIFNSLNIKPTSMIVIADGLASEILHLCETNKLGCCIFEEKLPIDPQTILACEEFKFNPTIAVLNGGEDYELLFSLRLGDYEKIKFQNYFSVIGYLTPIEEGRRIITKEGRIIPITH